jgi:hypothetical protein
MRSPTLDSLTWGNTVLGLRTGDVDVYVDIDEITGPLTTGETGAIKKSEGGPAEGSRIMVCSDGVVRVEC